MRNTMWPRNTMAPEYKLPEKLITDFGKNFDGLPAGDIGKCTHKISGRLHGHEMSAVCFLRDFEMLLLGCLKVACDGLTNIGHGFGNSFALGHAPRQAGTFGDVAVVFSVVNKVDFESHNSFLLCIKNIITPFVRQGRKMRGVSHELV